MFYKYKQYIIYFGIFVAGMAFAYGIFNISTDMLKGSLTDASRISTTNIVSDKSQVLADRINSGNNIEVIDIKGIKRDSCDGGKITISQIGGAGTVILNGPTAGTITSIAYTENCAKAGSYSLTITPPANFVLDSVTSNANAISSPYQQSLSAGGSIAYNINYKLGTGTVNIKTDNSSGSYQIYKGNTVVASGSGTSATSHSLSAGAAPGAAYKIVFGSVSGYATPGDISFALITDNSLNFEGKYSKSQGTVSVNTDIAGGSYAIYQGTSIVGSGNGITPTKHTLSASAAPGTSYKITFSDVTGYITPADIPFDLTPNNTLSYEGKYIQIQGNVTVSTNNASGSYKIYSGTSVIGSGSGNTAKQHALSADKSPGTAYKIVFEGVQNYVTPADISFNLIAGESKTFEGKYTEPSQSKLSVESVSNSTFSSIIVAGTSDVLVSEYSFSAAKDAFTIKTLTIINDNPADPDFDDPIDTNVISSVKIKYPDSKTAGEMKTATGTLTNGSCTFSNLDFYIAKDSSANLKIYADIKSITADTFSLSGKKFTLGLRENNSKTTFEAVSESASEDVYLDKSGDIKNSGNIPTFIVRKSKPVFTSATQTNTAMPAADGDLYKFTVAAVGGDVSFSRFVFDVYITGFNSSGSDIYGWNFKNTSGVIKEANIWGQGALNANNAAVYLKDSLVGYGLQDCNMVSGVNAIENGLYKVIVTFDKEQTVKSGKSETYTLTASVAGALINDVIEINLASGDEKNEPNIGYDYDNDNGFGNTAGLIGDAAIPKDSLFDGNVGSGDDENEYFGDTVADFAKYRNIIWSDNSGGDFAASSSGNASAAVHIYPTISGSASAGAGTITDSSGSLDWTNGWGLGVNKLNVFKFVK